MQALRLASFTSRPTLRGIKVLIMLAPYLTNSGRFLDAWSISGLTIRLAHSIGLHRNPRYLDPAPSLRESTVRKNLWWWLLHMDQEYSMTLGRPLGISGIGDCPPPEPLTTDPVALRLSEFFDQLTIQGRQILSSNQLTDSKIDMYTDRLIALWDTMPESLQFNKSWIEEDTQIPEWPMETRAASEIHLDRVPEYTSLTTSSQYLTAVYTTISFSLIASASRTTETAPTTDHVHQDSLRRAVFLTISPKHRYTHPPHLT